MSIAFLFPGQGSQSVGMGRDLVEKFPAAKAVFEEADDALAHGYATAATDMGHVAGTASSVFGRATTIGHRCRSS